MENNNNIIVKQIACNTLALNGKHSDIDYYYGPYTTLEEACIGVPRDIRGLGLTVGVYLFKKDNDGEYIYDNVTDWITDEIYPAYVKSNDTDKQKYSIVRIKEYQWLKGIEDEHLVEKIESFNLTISAIGELELIKEEGDNILFEFRVTGRATISKGFIYQVIGNTEVFLGDFTNIGKGTNTYVLNNPSTSGIYKYRIKILDSSGAYATTMEDTEYIEYTVRYGGISVTYNLTNLNSILIKNKYSVAEKHFICTIRTRDDSFNIQGLYLSDSQQVTANSTLLLPYSDLINTQADSYLGDNYYYFPNSDDLEKYNGKLLYLIIKYTENTGSEINQLYKVRLLFILLDTTSLELVSESTNDNYYLSIPSYYVFLLYSGVENISVVFSQSEDSDFEFETVTILAYRKYFLKVIPKVIKEDARLKANFSFRYNNIETTGSFDVIIGNIVEVPALNYFLPSGIMMSRRDIVDPSSENYDVIEDGKYTKIISDPISTLLNSSSFILDLYCKINQTNNRSTKYLTINYGTTEIGYITEDDIFCSTIKTDTPLNEWVQIGIGVNLVETVVRNGVNTEGWYHAIYINGMVVKNIPITEDEQKLNYDDRLSLNITLSNGILVLKCFTYYKTNGVDGIDPNTNLKISIIYNNYKSHKTNFSEPGNLPILKLKKICDTTENEYYFNLINSYKEEHDEDLIKHTTTFGSIGSGKAGTMASYDPTYTNDNSPIESNATLFRQHVDIKKPAQKEYAVLCLGQWLDEQGNNLLNGTIIEVHTQGTSTLQYSIPNFKLTFWKVIGDNQIEHFSPKFIEKQDYVSEEDRYYNEYIYTAKCDYMDSSHLNNTPTCTYYNNIIQTLIKNNEITGSPSARNGKLDAILGVPIIMYIKDDASDSFDDNFENIGSFMLNIDKTGDSLGFEIEENGLHLTCLSLEGTSNDNNTGASGRFVIPDEIQLKYDDGRSFVLVSNLKSYLDNNEDLLESEIEYDFNDAKNRIKNLSIPDALTLLPYVLWCNFLSQGLEYRYPDSDMYKEKSGHVNKILSLDHFKKIYKMWSWVNNSDSYDQTKYKLEFIQHFDLEYCMFYFIQLMIFGQTDNLGKNAMFDTWGDTDIWYPRPYDLDSQAGLDNAGNDDIATFVEIKPEFSLDYSTSYTQELLIDLKLTETSLILYGTNLYERYHYSSNNSKLWMNFYKNFKTEINSFYSLLKVRANYSADSIISLCEEMLINRLGINQYNQDFHNKYLANYSDLYLAYGNRWIKFKNWMRKRFAFCDSYFDSIDSATYSLTNNISYYLKVDSPQYVIQQYLAGGQTVRFVLDQTNFTTGSGAATFVTLKVNQNSVLDINLFKYVTLLNGDASFNNLLTLDVSGNNKLNSITTVVGNNLPNLKSLNISNSAVRTLRVPSLLKTLNAQNVTLDSIVFDDNCLIETIDLSGSTINGLVYFSGLIKLKNLNIKNCVFKLSVTFSDVEELEVIDFEGSKFEGVIEFLNGINITEFDFSGIPLYGINFSGSNLNFKKLNFQSTIFSSSTLNINAISSNIENLNFSNCQGLQHLELTDNNSFLHLLVFNILNSTIKSLGSDNTIFDASPNIFITGIGNLYKTYTVNPDNGNVTSTPFNFRDTKVLYITNISWTGTGNLLFYNCLDLISVTGTLNLKKNIDYLFTACRNLETLPTINIDITETNDAVISAVYALSGANKLGYTNIYNIIRKCTKVTNFTAACKCTKLTDNTEINLTNLFLGNSVVLNLTEMFRPSRYSSNDPSNITNITNTIKITGEIPLSVLTTDRMLSTFSNGITINYGIIRNAYNLSNALGMFYGSSITFVGSNLPTYTDILGLSIILSNTVTQDFFPLNHTENSQTIAPALSNILGIFYNTNILIIDTNVFSLLTNLTNCGACFGGTLRKFSVKNSEDNTEDIDLDINNIWVNNSKLTNVAGCFEGIYNIYCTGLTFHNNVTNINISGLFGLSLLTKILNGLIVINYKGYKKIFINIDNISPTIISYSYYSIPGNTAYYRGTFENREVVLISSGNTSILSKLSSNCRLLFKGSTLFVDSTVTTFDLSNVITSCYEMFRSCILYKYNNDPEYVYSDIDRHFVNVTMPSACSVYYCMFRGSSILKNLPELRSASSGNLGEMYYDCIINNNNVILPVNYFDICRSSVSNTSYMFANNKYLRELEYSESKGLLLNCTNLSNVTYMFSGTTSLHKGIPNNLFGTNETSKLTKLKSLEGMFKTSAILYDIEDGSNKWINTNTLTPITELTSIKEMFSYNRVNGNTSSPGYSYSIRNIVKDTLNNDIYIIDPTIFTNHFINDISGLFKNSSINIPFQFLGFVNGDDAFFDDSINAVNLIFITNLSNITRIGSVLRMFYDIVTGGGTGKTITNLDLFIDSIHQLSHIRKDYVAGNLANSGIPEIYKQNNSDLNNDYSYGFVAGNVTIYG